MSAPSPLKDRLLHLHHRYRRPFWIVHSIWALVTGAAVVWLARERYELVPWVVGFLALTWLASLLFGRAGRVARERGERPFSHGVVSYLTRIMYQEVLLFMLPLYAASTTVRSPNLLFTAVLLLLGVLACLDLTFDRLLRESPGFAFAFFAVVTFAAVNVLLPLVLAVPPGTAVWIAGVTAFVAAAPLAFTDGRGVDPARAIGAASAACLVAALVLLGRPAVPPAPLRLVKPVFAAGIDRETLEVRSPLGSRVALSELGGVIVFRCQVVAPSRLTTAVEMRWTLDGLPLHSSRQVDVVAHDGGFRLWDSTRRASHRPRPGRYEVKVVTRDGQLLGRKALVVAEGATAGADLAGVRPVPGS